MEAGAADKLFVSVTLGASIYVVDAAAIVEILPLVAVYPVPHAPSGLAGTITYRGTPVPVLDLSERVLGRPAPSCLSTRIVVVRAGDASLFGLIAPNATETLRLRASDFVPSGVPNDSARFLGPVATGPRGQVRRIEIDPLLAPYLAGGQTAAA